MRSSARGIQPEVCTALLKSYSRIGPQACARSCSHSGPGRYMWGSVSTEYCVGNYQRGPDMCDAVGPTEYNEIWALIKLYGDSRWKGHVNTENCLRILLDEHVYESLYHSRVITVQYITVIRVACEEWCLLGCYAVKTSNLTELLVSNIYLLFFNAFVGFQLHTAVVISIYSTLRVLKQYTLRQRTQVHLSPASCWFLAWLFLFIHWAGMKPRPLLLELLIGVLYQPWMIDRDDCGTVGGMNVSGTRKHEILGENLL
jgi:hypothetical protein